VAFLPGCGNGRRIFPSLCSGQCGDEREIHDSIAAEPAKLAGLTLSYYSLRRAANRHPLYKEPSVGDKDWEFSGPWELHAVIDWDVASATSDEATEAGSKTISEAILGIARVEFEQMGAPSPKIGDVVEFWTELPDGSSRTWTQWDVTKATADGEVWSQPTFVAYKLEVKIREQFRAIRKTEHNRI